MKRALLIFALALPLVAQTCTITAFPVQVANGQVLCPTGPMPPPASSCAPNYCNPASVLVVYQLNTGPETGTGGINASLFVAQHYMAVRGIPAANLLGISTYVDGCQPGCQDSNFHVVGSENLYAGPAPASMNTFMAQIGAPVLAALNANKALKYVVPVYGVPVTVAGTSQYDTIAVDSILAALRTPANSINWPNPYYNADPLSKPAHIDTDTSGIILVSRLDGPTPIIAAGLVDKAILGEAGIHGAYSYFDYGPLAPLGFSSLNAYHLCSKLMPAQSCVLNDQSVTSHMVQSAPSTAFAWGGYDLGQANAGAYGFVPGAVAAQMNSNSANSIRWGKPGAVAYIFLHNGVTATWGAVNEPYDLYYATGDNLLNHLWTGYTFGEAAYISTTTVRWMMVFVGDPLYRPLLK